MCFLLFELYFWQTHAKHARLFNVIQRKNTQCFDDIDMLFLDNFGCLAFSTNVAKVWTPLNRLSFWLSFLDLNSFKTLNFKRYVFFLQTTLSFNPTQNIRPLSIPNVQWTMFLTTWWVKHGRTSACCNNKYEVFVKMISVDHPTKTMKPRKRSWRNPCLAILAKGDSQRFTGRRKSR